MSRLEELVRKRTEIEAKISEEMQELNELYEAARREMREVLLQKIEVLDG